MLSLIYRQNIQGTLSVTSQLQVFIWDKEERSVRNKELPNNGSSLLEEE